MKFLVCISTTPDTTAKISFKDDGKSYDATGQTIILNPYDEWYALVRALELAESNNGTVTVIHVGPPSNDINIRKALAIGAHDAVRIDSVPADAMTTAKQIAAYADGKDFDFILTGKETIDYSGSEVGPMLAELLDLPFVSFASKLDMEGESAIITRDIEGGVEVVSVDGPCVLSAAKGLAEQRIPNMRGIMMAKRKPLEVLSPVETESHTTSSRFELPTEKSVVTMVDPDDIDELVRLLHEEAKVI